MKKLIITIIICVVAVYAWNKFDLAHYKGKVEMAVSELQKKKDTANELVAAHHDRREKLFQVLTLMNEVTINTMRLERIGEGNTASQTGSNLTMREQIEGKMELLRQQLDEAREIAKEDAELMAEIEKLQSSFRKREAAIQRLKREDKKLDEQLEQAVIDLEKENEELRNENVRLDETNNQLRSAITNRKRAELDAWILAGDELVLAARIIPKANSMLFSGSQSREITRSKQMILKSATECYNNAIRMGNNNGDRSGANTAHSKALEADRLFNLVTAYQSIGEESVD